MGEILIAVCDVCGKRQECPTTNMPPDWFRVRSFSYDLASDNARADVQGDACSRHCRAALLRNALTMIAAPEQEPPTDAPDLSEVCLCSHARSAHDARRPYVCDFNGEHPQPGRARVAGGTCRCQGFTGAPPGMVFLREGSAGSGRFG